MSRMTNILILYALLSYWTMAADTAAVVLEDDDCDDCPEYYDECTSACLVIATCQDKNPEPFSGACIDVCVPRWVCGKGYVRKEIGGECIRVEECPESGRQH